MLENYVKSVVIEANTMVSMAKTQILPAVESYAAAVARDAAAKKQLAPALSCSYEAGLVQRLSALTDDIAASTDALDEALSKLYGAPDIVEEAYRVRDLILPAMSALRAPCDQAELMTAKSYWPFPTYADLLFGVK